MADVGEPQVASFSSEDSALKASSIRGRMFLVAPEEDNRLIITEDQLEALVKGGDSRAFQWALAFLGAAIGFGQNLIGVAIAVYSGSTIRPGDTVLALICVACLAASLARLAESNSQQKSCEAIAKKIRSGKRHQVVA